MDIYIDTDVLGGGINSIKKTIRNVSLNVSTMKSCLVDAGNDFDTINYDRASNSIGVAMDAMTQMESNLDQANLYLQQLSELIEKYSNLKY